MPIDSFLLSRLRALALAALCLLLLWPAPPICAADADQRAFDLPADSAEKTLKLFSEQSGLGLIIRSDVVQDVRTNAVKGTFAPRDALDRMLAGTGLVASQDAKNGAFVVLRADDPAPADASVPVKLGASADSKSDQTVKLDPFEVQADSDKSYGALNSNSITRFNVELSQMPVSADIYDQAFMKDTASTTVEGMIQTYSAGAGSFNPNQGSAANGQPLDRNAQSYVSIRGLYTPSMKLNGFLPLDSWNTGSVSGTGVSSNFDIERVEIIDGPQALLYGNSGAGGIINLVSKEARIGQPAFGSMTFQVDQYGHRMGQLDYGMSNDVVAVRVAVLDQTLGGRREDIGGPLMGQYVQIAAKLFGNTIVRVMADQTKFNRIDASDLTLTAASTANDARNGQSLNYLLASNQIQASATGASGAGTIDNGFLNWGNIESYGGWWTSEMSISTYTMLTADTKWNSWLSSQFAVGYRDYYNDIVTNTPTIYAPNNAANPLPGQWTAAEASATPISDQIQPARTKTVRFSVMADNELFSGRVHEQTILGADFNRLDEAEIAYSYYQADSNLNVIVNPSSTVNGGRTVVPTQAWSISNGPTNYPLWAPRSPYITYNGVNYVRALENPVNPALISPNDPNGVTLGGGNYYLNRSISRGLYGANYMQFFNNKLDTFVGFRLEDVFYALQNQGVAPSITTPLSGATKVAISHTPSLNVGVEYVVTNWFRPYVNASNSYEPPIGHNNDPYGNWPKIGSAVGEEAGIKTQNASGTISGSLAFYYVNSKNEQFNVSSTFINDINPSGLNGRYGSPSVWINVNRQSEGVALTLTASPTPSWRVRLSAGITDGTVSTNTGYNQFYNDQFNENSQGQVTYADGTVVYVPATYNSHQLTVSSTTAGAVPLTVALMNNPASSYYANPLAVTGQIQASSGAGQVLLNGASSTFGTTGHGSILTGVTGLPISALQINPGFTPPGLIATSQAGDLTTGYPEFAVNLTNMYELPSGWAKGFKLGGTVGLAWQNRGYYYYPSGLSLTSPRTLFNFPDTARFDGIVGYERKFGRFTWSTQLNVNNMFNHYHLVILPNVVSGWTGALDATFDQQPRAYLWTNTISF